jgi:tripartite-type tricarboxylate transporter receptor subunit TctC
MFAPAGTPKPVLDVLNKAVRQAMDSDSVKQAFQKQYFNLVPNKSIEDARAWLAAELSQWKKIADDAKIDLED